MLGAENGEAVDQLWRIIYVPLAAVAPGRGGSGAGLTSDQNGTAAIAFAAISPQKKAPQSGA